MGSEQTAVCAELKGDLRRLIAAGLSVTGNRGDQRRCCVKLQCGLTPHIGRTRPVMSICYDSSQQGHRRANLAMTCWLFVTLGAVGGYELR